MTTDIIPAIDLRAGQVVRLAQGDYARQRTYPVDPVALAAGYAAAGVRWLHVVDLDGAQAGGFANLPVIEALARSGLRVQAGGGVRGVADVHRLLDAGVERVVVGSVAVGAPARVADWMQRHGGERFVIALDTRWTDDRWMLASDGWTRVQPRTLDELAPWYAAHGGRHLLCTDIERDGMLAGLNLALYRHLARIAPALAVQASGGVRSVDDIGAARLAGARGVILGRALLEGRFTLAEALAA